MARRARGAWRLHPSLVGAKESVYKQALRRVPQLRPDERGRFFFMKRNRTQNELGEAICDLFIRYTEYDKDAP